jgi:hypothetical protein
MGLEKNAPRPGIQALEYTKHGLGARGQAFGSSHAHEGFYNSESSLNSGGLLMNFHLMVFQWFLDFTKNEDYVSNSG